jgi:hypothetical protein
MKPANEKSKKGIRSKKSFARICCFRLKNSWSITRQFTSSIYILNLFFIFFIAAVVIVIPEKIFV